ncbi:hypothetical protein [Guptibacillus hwajinpoensis]|uniref:hypothetical protein n=1 Tax=Guptibacillus hwajinpoensis TaxID=208199 RepID=UPI003D0162E6
MNRNTPFVFSERAKSSSFCESQLDNEKRRRAFRNGWIGALEQKKQRPSEWDAVF